MKKGSAGDSEVKNIQKNWLDEKRQTASAWYCLECRQAASDAVANYHLAGCCRHLVVINVVGIATTHYCLPISLNSTQQQHEELVYNIVSSVAAK